MPYVTPAVRERMTDDTDRGAGPNLRVLPGGGASAASSPGPEDDALVAAFLVGDDQAFGELVRRNESMVLAIVRRWTRSPDDARDLAQRTFLRAFEAARRALRRGRRPGPGEGPGVPFRRWLVRIAVNLSKNHARDEARRARVPLSVVRNEEPAAQTAAPPDELQKAEQAEKLRREVALLPRRQREVLSLRLDAELPFAEIAQALGITENNAKVTFHHAARKLRAALTSREARP